jgi:tRNA dimethylallyltransferase
MSESPGSAPQVLLLCGPTAVGKTAVSLELAELLGAEIISVDSMQVYRGMDVGTAKPSIAERSRIRHHLVDILEPNETFDASTFLHAANQAVQDIISRGKVPLLCGGTGLYFKVFLSGLAESPHRDDALRHQLYQTPLPELLNELREKDSVTYERIDRQNPRRIVRALEVIRITGKPFSEQRQDWSQTRTDLVCRSIGLSRTSGDLRRRIEARVDEMFSRGLVDETASLLERGLDQNPVAMQALGYRQVVEHLRGVRELGETIELVKIRTWQFAKRQMTFLKGKLRMDWIHLDQDTPARDIAGQVLGFLAQRFTPR